MAYLIADQDGNIIGWEAQSSIGKAQGQREYMSEAAAKAAYEARDTKRVIGGEVVDKSAEEIADYLYQVELEAVHEARRQAYGSIQEQLDEIFHDQTAWRSRIAAIKAAKPLPVKGG